MSATNKVPLSSVVIKTTGGGTPERDNPEFWNGGIPWASVKDFKDGIYRLSKTKEEISEKGLKRSASHLIPAGTPIICTRMAVGRIARASVPVAINQDLRALHIRDEFDTDYVVWAVDSIRHRIENLAIGSTVKGISIDQLLSFEIEAPPKPEQTKIAEILSTVDRAIEQTEALIAKQQRLKTGLMQDLLTRGIDEHGNLRSEQTHQFKDSPLGRIPVEWEVKQIMEVGSVITGNTPPESAFDDDYQSVPFVTPADVGLTTTIQNTNRSFGRESATGVRMIPGGSICVVCIGSTIGKIGITVSEAATNQQINSVIPNDFSISDFLFHSMLLYLPSQLRKEAGLQAVPIVNKSTFERLLIAMPIASNEAIEIQRQISSPVTIIESGTLTLAKLCSLKTALMQELLTGRMRVTKLLID